MIENIFKRQKFLLLGVVVTLLIGLASYQIVQAFMQDEPKNNRALSERVKTANPAAQKTAKEYYNMFKCSCCGRPIDTNCCGDAKQKKEYLDGLLLKGSGEQEILFEMVKKFSYQVLMDPAREQEVRVYAKSLGPENPPQIVIENSRYNFGKIKQSNGVVSTTFTLKNRGKSDLIIESMDTSCACTTASLIYKGQESPEFGMSMHGTNPKNFELRIPSGESAVLKVKYDPNAHGEQKKPELRIIREVTIISNDPVDFQKKVRIELAQIP